MTLLLDAHALLWFIRADPRLSATARNLMSDPNNDLLLSTGTIWEIAIKVGLRKFTLAEPYDVFIRDAIADNDLTVLQISVEHAAAFTTLPLHHRDPFDRLLVAQALVEGLPLVSADPALDAYPITRLW